MDKNLQLLNINKNLNFYIQSTQSILLLSKHEEFKLSKKFKKKNDINAAKRLVEANINYVIKISSNYIRYGVTMRDLIQEGIIGLIKSIKNFNPEKNIRLISFAIYWIKSEIHEYIIRNLRLVRIATTKSQKKLFFNLNKLKQLTWLNNNEIKSISNLLNIKSNEIEYMESKLNKKDTSLDNTEKNNIQNPIQLYQKKITYEPDLDPLFKIEHYNWHMYAINNLKKALNKLDRRSKKILKNRWLFKRKYTLRDLGVSYKISSERIRQLENNAMKRLKNFIKLKKI